MNGQELFFSLTDVDDQMILDARESPPQLHHPLRTGLLVALIAALIAALVSCGKPSPDISMTSAPCPSLRSRFWWVPVRTFSIIC